jgi:Na+-driven multidrug efflux pump
MLALGEVCAYPLSWIFVGYDAGLMDMTFRGFVIYSFSFLFAGFAIFGSGFFTALSDGVTSAIIAFLRTLVFQVAAVLVLPYFFKLDGIWYSIVAAEVMAVALTSAFLVAKKNKYKYW